MLYNPENELDIKRAKERINYFIEHNKVFELTARRVPKTYPQLKYLHLILKWFALEYGETMEYIKLEYFKKLVTPELFEYEYVNRKTGEIRKEYKSTASLSKEELSMAIDRFRNYSAKQAGIYLPEPNDLALIREIEIQVENHKHYI